MKTFTSEHSKLHRTFPQVSMKRDLGNFLKSLMTLNEDMPCRASRCFRKALTFPYVKHNPLVVSDLNIVQADYITWTTDIIMIKMPVQKLYWLYLLNGRGIDFKATEMEWLPNSVFSVVIDLNSVLRNNDNFIPEVHYWHKLPRYISVTCLLKRMI